MCSLWQFPLAIKTLLLVYFLILGRDCENRDTCSGHACPSRNYWCADLLPCNCLRHCRGLRAVSLLAQRPSKSILPITLLWTNCLEWPRISSHHKIGWLSDDLLAAFGDSASLGDPVKDVVGFDWIVALERWIWRHSLWALLFIGANFCFCVTTTCEIWSNWFVVWLRVESSFDELNAQSNEWKIDFICLSIFD